MSDSVRPRRRQPTRLPHPWDSPGKNTGVGCHLLHQCIKVKSETEVAQSCPTLSDPMDCSLLGSSIHGIFQARVLEWGAIAFSSSSIEELLIFQWLFFSYFIIIELLFPAWHTALPAKSGHETKSRLMEYKWRSSVLIRLKSICWGPYLAVLYCCCLERVCNHWSSYS